MVQTPSAQFDQRLFAAFPLAWSHYVRLMAVDKRMWVNLLEIDEEAPIRVRRFLEHHHVKLFRTDELTRLIDEIQRGVRLGLTKKCRTEKYSCPTFFCQQRPWSAARIQWIVLKVTRSLHSDLALAQHVGPAGK
jgi:hypothetical protein